MLLMSMNLGAGAAQSGEVYFGLAGSGSEVWQPISEDMISPVLIEEALLEGLRFQDLVRSINSIKESISGSGTVNNVTIDLFQIDIMRKKFFVQFTLGGGSWTFIGYVSSPDLLVDYGGIGLVPIVVGSPAQGSTIPLARIRVAWKAFVQVFEDIVETSPIQTSMIHINIID